MQSFQPSRMESNNRVSRRNLNYKLNFSFLLSPSRYFKSIRSFKCIVPSHPLSLNILRTLAAEKFPAPQGLIWGSVDILCIECLSPANGCLPRSKLLPLWQNWNDLLFCKSHKRRGGEILHEWLSCCQKKPLAQHTCEVTRAYVISERW